MPIYRCVNELMRKLMESFDDSPANSGRTMRELMEKDRAAFLPAATSCLRQAKDSRGFRYLVALLAGNDMLLRCVCDPGLSMQAALAVARTAIKVNSGLDAALAREVINGLSAEGGRGDEQAIRLLDILGAISSGRRLLPLLTHLLQYPNPRVRSKVALLMGRRNRNARWVDQRKDEADPRVRANAIEGLWDSTDDNARHLLWESSHDPNNRVAGNALAGLYRMGDARAIARVLDMAAHDEPRFRATAAWVMGESADARFLPVLGRLLADPDKVVRARAFRSLAAIRQRVTELTSREQIHIHVWDARRMDDGGRRVRLAVVDDAELFPPVAATQFLITEGGEAVRQYEVSRRPIPVTMAVGWALPRTVDTAAVPLDQILRECLRHKRPSHQWAILPYSPEPSSPTEGDTEPRFSSNIPLLASLLERQVTRMDAAGGPLEAARLLAGSAAPLGGERHLVLVGTSPEARGSAKDLERIGGKARYHGIVIHGLALCEGLGWLESLCQATGGRLQRALTSDDIRAAIWKIFWGLQYQDEITYRLESVPVEGTTVKVQVQSDLGIAADCLPLQ